VFVTRKQGAATSLVALSKICPISRRRFGTFLKFRKAANGARSIRRSRDDEGAVQSAVARMHRRSEARDKKTPLAELRTVQLIRGMSMLK